MALHAEDALGCSGVSEIFNFALAVAALEAGSAKGLIAGQNGEVFNLVAAGAAAVGAVVAYERAIAEEQEVGVRVEEGSACVAAKAVYMPAVTSCVAYVSLGPELLESDCLART